MNPIEIKRRYDAGERDFSNITCTNATFDGLNLEGINLSGANLGFCSFRDTNLNGANLAGANLEWSCLMRAKLKRANMEKVRAIWSRFIDAKLENTNFREADLTSTLFFNVDLYGKADTTGANTTSLKLRPEEITEEDVKQLGQRIDELKEVVGYNISFMLQKEVGIAEPEQKHVTYNTLNSGNLGPGYSVGNGSKGLTYGALNNACANRGGVYGTGA